MPQLENGYAIWDFRGQEVVKHIQDRFKQFIWRPRPPTLLSKDKQKQIRKNLREFSRVFDEEDAAEESNVSAELVALRKRLVDEWNAWRTMRRKELGEEKNYKAQTDENKEEIEVWVEDVIEQIEEVVEQMSFVQQNPTVIQKKIRLAVVWVYTRWVHLLGFS